MMVPTGFHVTAAEMRSAGIRVHEEILDHTIYRPETVEQLLARVELVKGFQAHLELDGKCFEKEGDMAQAAECRERHDEIGSVLSTWRTRWRECRAEEHRVARTGAGG